MREFVMPALGADMAAGTLVAWRKRPGDHVRRGDIVAEVETDKGIIEVEAFWNAVFDRSLVDVGAKVPVGTVLALFRDEAQSAEPDVEKPVSQPPAAAELAHPAVAPPAASPAMGDGAPDATTYGRSPSEHVPHALSHAGGWVRASPAARALARELGVELASVRGTGRAGAVTRGDVLAAAEAAKTASRPTAAPVAGPQPTTGVSSGAGTEAAARMRQAIGAAMARSKREIPHYYLSATVNLHRAVAWLAAENERRAVEARLLPAALFVKAVARALREVPELNARCPGEMPQLLEDVHVGVAVSLRRGGLVAPALHHADRASLDDVMTAMRDLVLRARAGTLRSSEMTDATITVTNLGDQGVEAVFGIINPPQVAIVGFGKVSARPWVVEGGVVARPLVTVTLSADHRASDGHRGALFLAAVDRLLQEPEAL